MSSENFSPVSSIPWKGIGSVAVVLGMLLLLLMLLPKRESPVGDGYRTENTAAPDSSAARCERELARVLDAMRPGSLGILAQRANLIDELNRWYETCGSQSEEPPIARDAELLKRLLPEDEWERASNKRFLPQDASHVRLSLLARAIVDRIAVQEKSDRARVVALFDYVIRNVTLLPDEATDLYPLTPYEVLLFGQGTADHLAWTFGTLLKQMRLDAVILRPREEKLRDAYLVGAVVPRFGILLFDPRLGMMIPSIEQDNGELTTTVPATLTEAMSNDQVFRQFDQPGSSYPLTSQALQDVSVELIGDTSLWAPRMAQLQFYLPSEISVDLYDGLGENELREPAGLERVVTAIGQNQLPPDCVSVWTFPGTQIGRIEEARGAEATELATLFQIFSGPIVTKHDPRTGMISEGPLDRNLHVVRIEQLMGNHAQALKDYLPIRNAGTNSAIPLNHHAAEFAEFWAGVSQFEQGRYDPAVGTFKRYVQNRQGTGPWTRDSLEWINRCYIAMGLPEQAARLLASTPSGPRAARDAWLVKRWSKKLGIALPATGGTGSAPQQPPTPAEEHSDSASTAPTPNASTDESALTPQSSERPVSPPLPQPVDQTGSSP